MTVPSANVPQPNYRATYYNTCAKRGWERNWLLRLFLGGQRIVLKVRWMMRDYVERGLSQWKRHYFEYLLVNRGFVVHVI